MRTVAHAHRLSKMELEEIATGAKDEHIDDMEFLETLARRHCMIMPPWIYHVARDGHLEHVTPVRYTETYELDKANILLAVMKRLHGESVH